MMAHTDPTVESDGSQTTLEHAASGRPDLALGAADPAPRDARSVGTATTHNASTPRTDSSSDTRHVQGIAVNGSAFPAHSEAQPLPCLAHSFVGLSRVPRILRRFSYHSP